MDLNTIKTVHTNKMGSVKSMVLLLPGGWRRKKIKVQIGAQPRKKSNEFLLYLLAIRTSGIYSSLFAFKRNDIGFINQLLQSRQVGNVLAGSFFNQHAFLVAFLFPFANKPGIIYKVFFSKKRIQRA